MEKNLFGLSYDPREFYKLNCKLNSLSSSQFFSLVSFQGYLNHSSYKYEEECNKILAKNFIKNMHAYLENPKIVHYEKMNSSGNIILYFIFDYSLNVSDIRNSLLRFNYDCSFFLKRFTDFNSMKLFIHGIYTNDF